MGEWVPVLVIEDEDIVRSALKRDLKLYGFYVYSTKDGPKGLELAREKKPLLILLDWMMQGMDGMEVLAELKHNTITENIPVFMLTGKGMIGDLDQAFEIGADDYIIKPSDLLKLGKIVKEKWEKYEARPSNVL